jgi:hypothetical protein
MVSMSVMDCGENGETPSPGILGAGNGDVVPVGLASRSSTGFDWPSWAGFPENVGVRRREQPLLHDRVRRQYPTAHLVTIATQSPWAAAGTNAMALLNISSIFRH